MLQAMPWYSMYVRSRRERVLGGWSGDEEIRDALVGIFQWMKL